MIFCASCSRLTRFHTCPVCSGHLDGSVCLWDVRQCQKGDSAPIAKCQVHAQVNCRLSLYAAHSVLKWIELGLVSPALFQGAGFQTAYAKRSMHSIRHRP
eukprot:1144923-Pelagomonas_calceolata.AAC.4